MSAILTSIEPINPIMTGPNESQLNVAMWTDRRNVYIRIPGVDNLTSFPLTEGGVWKALTFLQRYDFIWPESKPEPIPLRDQIARKIIPIRTSKPKGKR